MYEYIWSSISHLSSKKWHIILFQHWKCEDLLLFSILYLCGFNIFEFWRVSEDFTLSFSNIFSPLYLLDFSKITLSLKDLMEVFISEHLQTLKRHIFYCFRSAVLHMNLKWSQDYESKVPTFSFNLKLLTSISRCKCSNCNPLTYCYCID